MRRLFFIERPAHRGPTLALIGGRDPMTQKKTNDPNVIAALQLFWRGARGRLCDLCGNICLSQKKGLAHD